MFSLLAFKTRFRLLFSGIRAAYNLEDTLLRTPRLDSIRIRLVVRGEMAKMKKISF